VSDRPRLSAAELDALESEIAEKFPSWRFAGVAWLGGDYCLRAERLGTVIDGQSASDAHGLLQVIEARERLYVDNDNSTVPITTGLDHDDSNLQGGGIPNG
jgi:hypothetical protein